MGTNTVAGYIIAISKHRCSFDAFGCSKTMKMEDIEAHEKDCPHRAIMCPHRECKRDVQIKEIENHLRTQECAIDLNDVEQRDDFFGGGGVLN